MDRRTLLKLLAAMAVAGCDTRSGKPKNLSIVVAGAGIIGASIAYHLARAGASVTVIDKEGPATHASRGTFAWINATWAKQPQSYHAFNQEGVANWHRLQKTLDLPVRWGGSLEWFENPERQQKLVTQVEEQVRWHEPARMIDAAEFAILEPNVTFSADSRAAYSPNDGAVDPVVATLKLLAAAGKMGATLRFPCELTDVSFIGGRLDAIETSTGPIAADKIVLATGTAQDLPARIAGIEIPQRSTPGIIAITGPMPRLLNRIVVAPGIHLHQRDDGRIVLGEQDGPPQNEAHALRLELRPNDFPTPDLARQHAARMLAVARKFAPAVARANIENVYVGWRPLPIDGHPVIGASPKRPDVYLAIMHSGVSLAPIVGQLAAQELIQETEAVRLNEYRPGRLFRAIKRY